MSESNIAYRCAATQLVRAIRGACARWSSQSVRRSFFTISLSMFLVQVLSAQISGNVFQDSNGSGTRAGGEIGVNSVTVTAHFANAPSVTTTTDSNGDYSFTAMQVPSGSGVRIEFTGLPSGYFSGPRGSGSATNVQFATAPATNVNLGTYYPCEFCQDNPRLLATNYYSELVADQPSNGLYYGSAATIVSFDYAARRAPPNTFNHSNSPNPIAADYSDNTTDISTIGNIQAIAVQRRAKRVLFGAMASSLWLPGANGIGQIYLADYSGAGSTFVAQAPFVNVASLPGVNLNPSSVAANRVGEYGLGGLATSDDDRTLFAINMGQRMIEMMTITLPASTVSPPTTATHIPLPSTTCTNGVFRANATTVYRGRLFVGGVCDGATGAAADVKGVVLEYVVDGLTAASVPSATHTFALSFAVNNMFPAVRPIAPWSVATVASSSEFQPMVTGIAFVDDGAMVLGFMPRQQYNAATQSAGFSVRLHASGGSYAIENNGVSGAYTSTARDPSHLTLAGNTNQSWPVNDGVADGPGGKWFFEQGLGHSAASISGGNVHPQLFSGGLTVVPGTGEIVMGTADPLEFNTWGVRHFDWATGRANFGHITGLAKASLIGDVEAICDVAPIELGNRIWRDIDGDGIQDPGEPGIAGVTVRLFSAANAVLATAVTNADGEYYFVGGSGVDSNVSDSIGIVDGAIAENTVYQIRVDNPADFVASGPLANTTLSSQNSPQPANANAARIDNDANLDVADSDAALLTDPVGSPSGVFPVIEVTTGAAGNNNHSLDTGFVPLPSVSGRVYRESGGNNVDDNPTGASTTTDPGIVTTVAISCQPANAYTGPSSLTTGTDGRYTFDGVSANAVCVITETQPAGYTNAYNSPGAGSVNVSGDTAGSVSNGTMSVTVPTNGSPLNNFAQQSADLTSEIVCAPANPVAPGSQVTCIVTCTNAGPGNAVAAGCAPRNVVALPGYIAGTCPRVNQTVASGSAISCQFQVDAPANGELPILAGTGAENDTVGGSDPAATNNSSNATISVAGVGVGGRAYIEGSTPANTADNGNSIDPGLVVAMAISCTAPSHADSTTTNTSGSYLFSDVPAGAQCVITQTQPSGFGNAYATPGATNGAPSNPPEVLGSTGNSAINIVVPNAGSIGNNFAEQGADMTSITSCTQSPVSGGVQVSCTVTCTNRGPGVATNAFCAVANATTLPGGPVANCAPMATSLAVNATLSCTISFPLSSGSSASVGGGTGALNDSNGGSLPSGGNNPSTAAVGAPSIAVPTLSPLAFSLMLFAILGVASARLRRRR